MAGGEHDNSMSSFSGASQDAYAAAVTSEQNRRRADNLRFRNRAKVRPAKFATCVLLLLRASSSAWQWPAARPPPTHPPHAPISHPPLTVPQAAEEQTGARLERLAAALGAARRERAALDAIHGCLVSADRHQCDLLQAAQVASLAASLSASVPGGAEAARALTHGQAPGGAAAGKAGFLAAIGGWTQRTAARVRSLVQRGCFDVMVWSGYVPSDADMR